MVVMSTHGRGPVSRFWLGSVADRVLRYVNMPVLLIRPPDEMEGEGIDLAAVRLYRLGRVRQEMAARDIGAVILSDPVNIRYATGTRNMQVFSQRNTPARYLVLTADRSILFEFTGAEHLGEEVFCNRKESDVVFRPRKAVPFIGIEDIGDRNARRLHRSDDLVAFGLLHARIVGPLRDQQRLGDLACLVERACRLEHREAFGRFGIAHPFVNDLHHRGPLGGGRAEQRLKV